MLVFWVAAGADAIKQTIGRTLTGLKPDVPYHRFEEFEPGKLVKPEPGEIVVVCGARPLEILQKEKLVPRGRSLASLREQAFLPSAAGGRYMMTFDPGVVRNEPEKRALIDWDVRLANRLLTTGSLVPPTGDYQWVGEFAPLIARIEARFEQTGKPVDVACDTETEGLYPQYPERGIVSIGFTDAAGRAELLYTGPQDDPVPIKPGEPLLAQIEWLLTSPKVKLRGANFKFDLIWIAEKWGIQCTNFAFDTCLVGSLVDETRSNSLNLHAKVYTPLGGYDSAFNAKYDKEHMELVPLDDLRAYHGGDVDATYQVADKLRDELVEDERLARFYLRILHPAARAFERIERRGLRIDVQKYHQLRDDLTAEIKEQQAVALALLPARLRLKHRDKIEAQLAEGKSPFTAKVLKEFFFGPLGLNLTPKMKTAKSDEPSTSRAHLKMFAEENAAAGAMCGAMQRLTSAEKTRSTFVDGFLRHLRPDGLLHPSYMLHHGAFNDDDDEESGSVSGRLACKDPSFNTLPKKTKWAKRLRECYIAPPGKVIVLVDYSQGELRVVACIAPEENMIAAYQQGLDLHAVTGAKLVAMELDDFLKLKFLDPDKFTSIRERAKPANFGLLYGIGVEGFMAYCWAVYGLKLTVEEATHMRRVFFETYPDLLKYHDNQRKFVRMHGYVRSPLGRVRHLETIRSWDREVRARAERQSINAPVQSCLNEMMLWAISIIEREIPEDELAVVGDIHDAFMGYANPATVQTYARQAAQIMEHLPLAEMGWEPQVRFPADAEMGPDLAHLTKMQLAA